MWLEITELKKTWFMCLLDLFEEKGGVNNCVWTAVIV